MIRTNAHLLLIDFFAVGCLKLHESFINHLQFSIDLQKDNY